MDPEGSLRTVLRGCAVCRAGRAIKIISGANVPGHKREETRTASPTREKPTPHHSRRAVRWQHLAAATAAVVASCLAAGCRLTRQACRGTCVPPCSSCRLLSPERLDRGYAVILPGILGPERPSPTVAEGLAEANVPLAIEEYDWTAGPWSFFANLRNLDRNCHEAQKLAAKIMDYQDRYPGRPVHLIGYSAGCGVAILTLEALPPDRKITSAVLLAPSVAADYDLRLALSHTESGIHNFYSHFDVPALVVLTTLFGTTDGRHTIAAGASGFEVPDGLEPEERRWYEQGVIQHHYTFDMLGAAHAGGHLGWINQAVVRRWVAPLLTPSPGEQVQTVSFRSPRPQSPRSGSAD